MSQPIMNEGRRRTIIEGVTPEVDGGRYPIKRTVGESVVVEADIFGDGHDQLAAVILYKEAGSDRWSEAPLLHQVNDRWRGEFSVNSLGSHVYTVQAWVDHFKTWQKDLRKRVDAGQDVTVDLLIGAELVEAAAQQHTGDVASKMQRYGQSLRADGDVGIREGLSSDLARLMEQHGQRPYITTYDQELRVTVDRERARFSSWYELFPRSCGPDEATHGTFKDCEARILDIAAMGFDVVYLPPIHPIGDAFRKGKNNSTTPEQGDVGSPWAIGSSVGGHKAIHPQLGSLADFQALVATARQHGIDIALDVAFQCSPDHPYVKEHPDWFISRPDGTIQYAENPPKKYQDIYPINFESADWQNLWAELKSVFDYWIAQGVTIFRVDNPHTKAFRFWEWCIAAIKEEHPEAIFLAEAFTRPKVMKRLAKVGFTQSYTYFTWRNHKWDLTEYFTELTQTPMREYFRPNPWPNTPDILHEFLQQGGRPAFMLRLVLAATLGSNYGVYGPAYELFEGRAVKQGSEEYLNSEKYQIRHWDLDRPDSLKEFMGRINQIRHHNRALQSDWSLKFHPTDTDQIICYSKQTPDLDNRIIVVVSLDPHYAQAGWVHLDLGPLGIAPDQPLVIRDLIDDVEYTWHGSSNYVKLDPWRVPAHIFRVEGG
jgi:starch synthase (maltosyl-transferring)